VNDQQLRKKIMRMIFVAEEIKKSINTHTSTRTLAGGIESFFAQNPVFNPRYDVTVAAAASINPSVCVTYDLTRFLKKRLLFDDGISQVTNDNLYLAIGTTPSDGANIGGVNAVEVTYVLETEYTDA
jgi:hypothetical protein